MEKKVRIIQKKDTYSMEYDVGDVLTVDSVWYGGVTVLGKTGIPVSIDKDEYEEIADAPESADSAGGTAYFSAGDAECGLRPAGKGVSTEKFSHLQDIEKEVRGERSPCGGKSGTWRCICGRLFFQRGCKYENRFILQ